MKSKITSIIIVLLALSSVAPAQNTEYSTQYVKTITMHLPDSDFGYPICQLGEPISLEFDVLDDKYASLSYSIQHCNSEFEADDLSFEEFAEGFNNRPVDEYNNSFNTLTQYTHYSITIPNRDIKLLISGNYIINVYDDDNPDTPILSKRFMVYEDADNSKITASITQPFLPEYQMQCQQIAVTFDNSRLKISNPSKYLSIYAMQNGDYTTRRRLPITGFLNNDILYHKNDNENIFYGISEFHFLDAKDVHFRPLGVDAILYRQGRYHYVLTPLEYSPNYSEIGDLNGNFYIKNDRAYNFALESDYIDATFRFKYDAFTDCNIYLYGALTNWQRDSTSLLQWNAESEVWKITKTIKQGLYNYEFIVENPDGTFADFSSGSSHYTSNDYIITVYTTFPHIRGERLVMYKIVDRRK